jgi:hypothetical protein
MERRRVFRGRAGTHSFKREVVEEGYYVVTVESSPGWRDYVEFYVAG